MNVYLLRHSNAGTRRINPLLDVKRPLDKEGKQHCLHLAHVLNALKVQFDLIVSSPLKRSVQTAALIGTETAYDGQLLLSNALAPAAAFPDFQRLLGECKAYENVLLVGHNPNLTSFAGSLLVPHAARVAAQLRLRKGSLARINLDRGSGVLQWLLDPRTVRALYSTSIKSSRRKISRK